MPVGIMIPARQQSAASMMGRNTGTSFGSSSVLSLSQPNLLEGGQQIPLQYQHGSNHQLLEMAAAATAESEMARAAREDGDFESKSAGSENIEGASGDDQDQNQRPRKKRYHRHTQHQIQEMESFFKECPHPDDKQRKELSRELGLEPLQIKFWFQNKRTQMKNQHERHENSALRAENEKLRAENMRYKEALSNASCPNCGGPAALGEMSLDEHHLRIENARLREEIDRISGIAAKYVGKPMATTGASYPLLSPTSSRSPLDLGFGGGGSEEVFGGDLLRGLVGQGEMEKPVVVELAVAAMEELIRMAQLNEPLWVPHEDPINSAGVGAAGETLNEDEYVRAFPRGFGPKQFGLKTEASRETAVVIMNQMNVVEMLMDVNQWSNVFTGIVSRAFTLEVLSTGVAGNYNGALQVMSAEFQVPSPLVPTREILFVRYCKQHPDGTWAVVDVSLDSLRPGPVLRCRRRPSGCLIQEMPNGYSKVTWVEHVEVDDRSVHNIYKPLVNSGLAFGAKRWVCTLDRQCERLASAMASNIPSADIGVITSAEGRKSMLKLAERMVMSFCGGVSASTTHQWTTLSGSGAEDVRVMTRKSVDDPGRPPGIVLNAATSFWLPVSPKRVFDFLRDETTRSEWDILSNGGVVQEMAHIANGQDQGNCVSLLRVNEAEHELESEQHADTSRKLHRRDGLLRHLRAGGRHGHERGVERRRPGLRGAPPLRLRHPPRRAFVGVASRVGRRLPSHRRLPDPRRLRPDREALPRLRGHRQQPHRLHRRAHQGVRRRRNRSPLTASSVASEGVVVEIGMELVGVKNAPRASLAVWYGTGGIKRTKNPTSVHAPRCKESWFGY